MDRPPHPPLKVVALRYQAKDDRAPKIAAKGRGYMAERILEIAKAQNIPVREDKNLVEILSRLDLDQEIPPEVYKAVAEILAFVYRVSQRCQASCPQAMA
jgi:flagellar biosynthesis protein